MPTLGSDWLFRDKQGKVTTVKPNSRLQMTNALALKQCALANMGLTMCSKWSLWQEVHEGALVPLFRDYDTAMVDFENAVWLVYPSRHYLPLKVRVFIDFMKDKFQSGSPWDCKHF